MCLLASPSTAYYGYQQQASNPSVPMLSPAELAEIMHVQAQNDAAYRNQHQNQQAKPHQPQPQGSPVQAQAQNHPQAQPSPSPPPAVRKPPSPSPDEEEYEDEGYDEGPENHSPPMRGMIRGPEDERDSYANEHDEEARDYGARRPLRHRRPQPDGSYGYRRPIPNHIRNSPRDHRYEEDRYRDPDPGVPVSAAGGFDPPPRHYESRYKERLPPPRPSSYSYNSLHQRPRGYNRPDEIEDERDYGRSPSEARDTRSHPSTYGYYNSEEFVRNEPPPPPPPHHRRPVDDEDYERNQRLRGPPPSNYHPVNDYHRDRHHPDGPYH